MEEPMSETDVIERDTTDADTAEEADGAQEVTATETTEETPAA